MAEHRVLATRAFHNGQLAADLMLRIADGVVQEVQPAKAGAGSAMELPATATLVPGFIDLQVNGGGGVLFNAQPDPEGLETIAAAHHRLGTAGVLPTVITDRPKVLVAAADAVLAARGNPRILGLHIEGPHIDPAKRGTHAAAHIRPFDQTTLAQVKRLRAAGLPVMITLAPEAATPDDIRTLVALGAIVSLGHSNCDAEKADAAFAAGAGAVTHLFNAMSQMQGRAPGLTGAAIMSHAAVGMICDGIHVDDRMLALALAARPEVAESFIVSDAMPTVGGPDHFTLYGQAIRLSEGRLINAEGNLAGAHTTMAEGVARLVRHVGCDLAKALQMAITVPAGLIGRPDLAALEGRRVTDLMVLDSDLRLTGSLVDVIDKQRA